MRRDFRRPPPDDREPVGSYARRRLLIVGLVFLITFVLFPGVMLAIYLVMTWLRGMNRLDDAGVARVVADLRSADPAVKLAAAKRLTVVTADRDRREVAEALKPLLAEKDFWLQHNAVEALARWGNAEDAAAVAPLLQEENHGLRWPAIKALGQLKGPVAATALVKHLANAQDRGFTGDALKQLGPDAEPALIAGVEDADTTVREKSCEVLGSLGTRRCVAALEKAGGDPEPRVAQAARHALQQVQARK
jgi:HEAT repeat protein